MQTFRKLPMREPDEGEDDERNGVVGLDRQVHGDSRVPGIGNNGDVARHA